MEISIPMIIIICSAFAGGGAILDKLLLNRTRGKIHECLIKYWCWLDAISVPNMDKVLAVKARNILGKLYHKKKKNRLQIFFLFTISSFILTYFAICLGYFIGLGSTLLYSFSEIHNNFLNDFKGTLFIFIANVFFDFVTVYVTYWVLKKIIRTRKFRLFVIPFLIIFDWFVAFFLAVCCIGSCSQSDPLIGEFIPVFLFASTTLIPSFIFFSCLILLFMSKFILIFARKFFLYFVERVTEVKDHKELQAFTLTGALFSLIVIVCTVITKIAENISF